MIIVVGVPDGTVRVDGWLAPGAALRWSSGRRTRRWR
jgi:hypothetical protein